MHVILSRIYKYYFPYNISKELRRKICLYFSKDHLQLFSDANLSSRSETKSNYSTALYNA